MTKPSTLTTTPEKLLDRALALSSEQETKKLYTDWANTYDKTMIDGLGYLTPRKAAQLLDQNVTDKQAKILDVGVGTGLVGQELAALRFKALDGIDFSAAMLKEAKNLGIYGALVEADLNKPLAIADCEYDALICVGTFTHGHVEANCLDELFRILKPGGKFVAIVRKTYWEPAGFKAKVDQFIKAGAMIVISNNEDSNYSNSTEAESYFLVWEKC